MNNTISSTKNFNQENNQRNFIGVWIPKHIWERNDIKPLAKMLWAEITALEKEEGCFASNAYLADFLGVTERYIKELISELKEKKLLYQVKFDGKRRWLKTISRGELREELQFLSEVRGEPQFTAGVNHSSLQGGTTVHPYNIEENKEDIKKEINKEKNDSKEIYYCPERKRFMNITDQHKKNWHQAFPALIIQNEIRQLEIKIENENIDPKQGTINYLLNRLKYNQSKMEINLRNQPSKQFETIDTSDMDSEDFLREYEKWLNHGPQIQEPQMYFYKKHWPEIKKKLKS